MHPPKAKSAQLKEKKKAFTIVLKNFRTAIKKRYISYQRKIINQKQFAMILEIKKGKN
jgi:hypothetical protein